MTFTDDQVRKLKSPVRRDHVKAREAEGKTLHYLEGWRVVSEANRIFGFDAWERETVSSECVWRSPVENRFAAAYLTRIRIRVRAGDHFIVREGLGAGEAVAATPGQAHERASKAAETDATKRALSTFGSRFGLSLYGEREVKAPTGRTELGSAAARVVREAGERMRKTARKPDTQPFIAPPLLSPANAGQHSIRGPHPFMRGPVGPIRDVHGDRPPTPSEVSQTDAAQRLKAASAKPETEIDYVPVHLPTRIDKSVLTLSEPRRLRDRHHLKFVARQPCLVCGRMPSQAHHLRIAQPRALGRKVSDEFTVPLCALHHHDLHMKGNEAAWWAERKIDPMPAAEALWRSRGGGSLEKPSATDVTSGPHALPNTADGDPGCSEARVAHVLPDAV